MAFDQFRGRVLSLDTISTDSDISVSQLHRWMRDGHIKVIKLGYRMTRIDGDSLADFLTSRIAVPRPPRCKRIKTDSCELNSQA
jgi:hypothetical protein